MKKGRLPCAEPLDSPPQTFEELRLFVGNHLNIKNIDVVRGPIGSMICSPMTMVEIKNNEVAAAIESAARELVRVKRVGASHFINMPMLYPDGSFVTVCVERGPRGVMRVSDAGFAFREADEMGYARSFTRTANGAAEATGVEIADKIIFCDASSPTLERAVIDVAETSWRVAGIFGSKFDEEEDAILSDELSSRLKTVFGASNVTDNPNVLGSSTIEWPVTAVVSLQGHRTVFQAVGGHANSVYRTSTAFRDIALMEHPPGLVAVVRSKPGLGAKLALLSPAKIIEETQPDEFFLRAAA